MQTHLTNSQFRSTVKGIPCIVDVTYYEPPTPAGMSGHPDNWTAPDPGDIEVELRDRKGFRAPWLEKRMSERDWELVHEAAYSFMESVRD